MMPDHSDLEVSHSRPSSKPPTQPTRQDRSAAALRANLARRKEQARVRSSQGAGAVLSHPSGSDPDGESA
jgi:hypothetical protein